MSDIMCYFELLRSDYHLQCGFNNIKIQILAALHNNFTKFLPQGSTCVCPNYMSRQSDINEKMRAILIDWLIEVL